MHLNSIEFETIISHTNEPIDNSYWKSAQINSQMSPNSSIINDKKKGSIQIDISSQDLRVNLTFCLSFKIAMSFWKLTELKFSCGVLVAMRISCGLAPSSSELTSCSPTLTEYKSSLSLTQ